MELTLKERQKLTRITAKKYRRAKKREKSKIPDTFIAQTGYGRRYAVTVLNGEDKIKPVGKRLRFKIAAGSGRERTYPRICDQAVLDALALLREAFNCQCGKLFAPFPHTNIVRITANPKFTASDEVLVKLRCISAAAIDRLLKPHKARLRLKGTCGTKPAANHLKALIPALSHYECKEHGAGLWRIDLVQHDGGNPSGEFCFTLTVTEVKSAWIVHYALKNKAFRWVFQALNNACSLLPIPARMLHSDNGSEFINHALAVWRNQQGIALARSRNDRKNDNCFVEQKNGASVRKIVGYARYTGDCGAAALQSVFTHYDRLLNFFYPCRKLISKERKGSKVKKTYDKPMAPYNRIIADTDTPQEIKKNLSSLKDGTDLMNEMKYMQQAIDKLPSFAVPIPIFVPKRSLKPLRFGSHGSIFT